MVVSITVYLLCTSVIFAIVVGVGRVYGLLHKVDSEGRPPHRKTSETCSLAVFLGSGGHTTEALALLSVLDFSRYTPRTYIISEGDVLSLKKAQELENSRANSGFPLAYDFLIIPRARQVHQPLVTTPLTALWSLMYSIYHLSHLPTLSSKPFAEVLLLTGPGTCFVLALVVYIHRFFGLHSPLLIYVESFARVKSLSLSGKLLRPLVDKFVVQWPNVLVDGRRGDCRGWLV